MHRISKFSPWDGELTDMSNRQPICLPSQATWRALCRDYSNQESALGLWVHSGTDYSSFYGYLWKWLPTGRMGDTAVTRRGSFQVGV